MKVPEPRKLPSGSYFIQLRLGGESVPVTALTAKECRDMAMLIKAQHRAGGRQDRHGKASLTLTQAIDSYIAVRSNTLSPATIRGYRTIQHNRFAGTMQKPLRDIKNWQKLCNAEAELCSAKTLKNAYRFIVSVLAENGIAPPKITLPQIVPKERPWLEPEQVKVFIKAIKGEPCEVPALLALHSLRRSEICALTWENINLSKGIIAVKGAAVPDEKHKLVIKATTKSATSNRVLPIMIPELAVALKAIKSKSGLVVELAPDTIRKQINAVCRDAELPEVGIHGLRHSFASLAYHLGMSERETMELGGWADTTTMRKIYTHLAQRDRTKAVNKMADFYSLDLNR